MHIFIIWISTFSKKKATPVTEQEKKSSREEQNEAFHARMSPRMRKIHGTVTRYIEFSGMDNKILMCMYLHGFSVTLLN